MKTAVIQMKSTNDKDKNIRRALDYVYQAIQNKAGFILLPEVFNYRGEGDKKTCFHSLGEFIPGESIQPFMKLAKKHKVFILVGSLYEKARRTFKVYNTSVLLDDKGEIVAKYRKINLFEARINERLIKESLSFLPGQKRVLAQVKGFKVGLSICYDLRFPVFYQRYAKDGAHILCIPSSFTYQTGKDHWECLLRARAIENLCYVLAPNQIGGDGRGILSYGHSMIIDPWGKVLAKASGTKEEILYADLRMVDLIQKRKALPLSGK